MLGTALALTAAMLPAQAQPTSPPPTATPQASKASARITLITGDRVRVSPGSPERISFEPAAGSRSDAAVTTYSGGRTYVVPSAAAADVSSGRLDRSLFDITTLLAEQRDDAHSATMPVIIRYAGTPSAALGRAKATPTPGATKTRVLTSIGARAAAITKAKTGDFWRSITPGRTERVATTIQRISLDRRVKISLDQSVPQIGAPAAWQRGLTGKGVKVAILDTGIDPNHPDFAGRIGAAQNFTPDEDAVDHRGHGTHVASITAGNGGKYKGVAPEATLLNGKVLDNNGSGDFSGIIAGMEWAATQGASVVNLSLGSRDPSDGTDDLSLAVNRLSRDTGILFVVAAGNCFGNRPSTITSPAAADDALAVGNLRRDGSLNPSSCRGPRLGDGALKPEVSAPGTDIVAARAAGTDMGEPVDDNYTSLSGTSMATPHVAGTAALVVQAHPEWKATQLKARLVSTADPQPGSRVDEQGAGRIDADQATDGSITVDTGELELGKLPWPRPATDQVTRELTYRNPTGTAITLQLAASLEPAAATPTLSTDQLVVPANGEAKVTVTADRTKAGTGNFSGRITATGTDPIVTTFGWYAEPEQYDLTIKGINRDGTPASGDVAISRLDGDPVDLPGGVFLENGTATVRLPPGKYEASSIFFTPSTDQTLPEFNLAVGPAADLTENRSVTLDASKGKPVEVSAQGQPGLTNRERSMSYLRKNTAGDLAGGNGISTTGHFRVFTATPATKPVTGSSEFAAHARLEVPPYRGKVVGGNAYTVNDFYFGPRFTGVKELEVADAGDATPEDLKDVKGKLALIRYDDEDWNGILVKAAEDAGAAAAMLYKPDASGDGAVFPYWATGEGEVATIPAMRVSRVTAKALLGKRVQLTGQAATPVVYDLVMPWQNQIPAVAKVVAKPDQLARVDEVFGSHQAGVENSESRHASTPGGSSFGGWLVPTFQAPLQRTSYLLGNAVQWRSTLVLDNGGASLNVGSTERTYRAGDHSTARWIAPVENSGLPDEKPWSFGVLRSEGGLSVVLSPLRHGDEFAQPESDTSQLVVERNGEELATAPANGLWTEAPADAADYRVTLDTSRELDFWKYSTQVKSVWSFRSRGGEDEVMPLVLADLDVPQADTFSQVRVGKPTTITMGLRHQAGSKATARFTAAKLELSYDGTNWTMLPLTKVAEGKYRTTVTHPANQAGKAPSLRLTAKDTSGGQLEQEVTKAYGLK
ncbi:S8 family peptidase [Kribbella catacumbae]|uniref:S8 family peptidase n=1 Tax=Kribbella catacumbae TaxID=460086 RepID=UPI0003819AD3|nr:S8 family serine peptidase [Kribbella catacumbae]